MKLYLLRYLLLIAATCFPFPSYTGGITDVVLESPRVTNFGKWGELESCPDGTYVTAMQLKVQPWQGAGLKGDDLAATGVRLSCTNFSLFESSRQHPLKNVPTEKVISSDVGIKGKWNEIVSCDEEGVVVGYRLKVEGNQGKEDDTATNDVQIVCAEFDTPLRIVDTTTGQKWGKWGPALLCPPLMAVCGIRTQIDDDTTGQSDLKVLLSTEKPKLADLKDSTGLNNVDMKCCVLPRESIRNQESCSPVFKEKTLLNDYTANEDYKRNMTITQSLQWTPWNGKVKSLSGSTDKLLIPFDNLIQKMVEAFGNQYQISTNHDWSRKRKKLMRLSENKFVTVSFRKEMLTRLSQPVAQCGWLTLSEDCIVKTEMSEEGVAENTICYSKASNQKYMLCYSVICFFNIVSFVSVYLL